MCVHVCAYMCVGLREGRKGGRNAREGWLRYMAKNVEEKLRNLAL